MDLLERVLGPTFVVPSQRGDVMNDNFLSGACNVIAAEPPMSVKAREVYLEAHHRRLGEADVFQEDAEEACAGEGADRLNCISDVMKSGDIEFAQAY